MLAYIIRRLLLIIPTIIGIMVINFVIVQFAPGGGIVDASQNIYPNTRQDWDADIHLVATYVFLSINF